MVEYKKKEQVLDKVFAALADHSRRQMLARLRKGSLSISELAEPFAMSFAGVAKHIEVLTEAQLVRKVRAQEDGRSYRLELQNQTLAEASDWIRYHQEFWTNKLASLEVFLEEKADERPSSKSRKRN
ncbi:ArsR family transcriptional regulator [Leptospira levettii]|uniref:ArsR family transcriptional regulator n=1 Tax=Leptospira levettii TaxID=2023178 RepID=A0A5F2AGY2_9LEPT|nr:metalloregulator ArsR/SmtB family transcription factor [Leptospira levettii]MCW7466989.1 helix-turn-helix domain-containing protein [Leptospira levettii]MCW7497896.1 helix-turn-helix domain-containing protein [Leptospira levettii]MCW7512711.1 helix-turn-helix domain-containing protein [Leptospira levettii]MCW7516433.1 helix-turn-helix domain-containing protein [Leptospira levettii]TGL72548.1 ArsR family transcriptional regulator [Leptospira levettii]